VLLVLLLVLASGMAAAMGSIVALPRRIGGTLPTVGKV
jgi:hypothetical protein